MRPILPVFALLVACKPDPGEENHPPVVDAVADVSSAEGEVIDHELVGTDPDGDALTWRAAGLPPGLTLDPSFGRISGTVSFDAAADSPFSVDIAANDGDADGTASFSWTVTNTDRLPVIDAITDATFAENEAASLTVTGTDPDGEDLAWSAEGLPDTLTIDVDTGEIAGTLSYDDAGEWLITVRATTPSGASSASFTLTVTNVDRAPTLAALPDLTNLVGNAVNIELFASATDPDGDALTWFASGFPPGVNMATPGILAGTITGRSGSPYTTTIGVESNGLASEHRSFTWTVNGGLCAFGFTDVTSTAGITGTVSRSVLWLDADNDGDQDAYVSGAGLFINDGAGVFTLSNPGFDATITVEGVSNAVADFDNDGDLDLFIGGDTRFGTVGNRLLLNNGAGTFTDQSTTWGVKLTTTTPTGTAAIDYNADNWIDLAASTSFGSPHLWRNTGTPPFADATSSFPGNFQGDGLVFGDVTGDGVPEAYLSTGSGGNGNFLFVWTVSAYIDEALARGVQDNPTASGRWGGATFVDVDSDGDLDLHSVNSSLDDLLYLNDGTGNFTTATIASRGLMDTESGYTLSWADADLDGDLDAFVPTQGVYLNDGTGHFTRSYVATLGAHGAWADLDGDLDLDLITGSTFGAPHVWRNNTGAGSGDCTGAGSIGVRALTDRDGDATDATVTDDRDAIGADVWVDLDGDGDFTTGGSDAVIRYTVGAAMSGRSVQSQLPLVIGIGSRPSVDVRVRFPDGTVVDTLDLVDGDVADVLDN